MYRVPDAELTWRQFSNLPHIQKLPLNEQTRYYNAYLENLSSQRQQYINWLQTHNKGPKPTQPESQPVESVFLLQEDLFDLLQENGDKIIITSLP